MTTLTLEIGVRSRARKYSLPFGKIRLARLLLLDKKGFELLHVGA
jgi:hypothetical protein